MDFYGKQGDLRNFENLNVIVYEIVSGEDWSFRKTNLRKHGKRYLEAELNTISEKELRNLWETMKHKIPRGLEIFLRFCRYSNENIYYPFLKSEFYIHAVTDSINYCSAKETQDVASYLGLPMFPIIYEGLWLENMSGLISSIPSQLRKGMPYGIFIRQSNSIRIADIKDRNVATCNYPPMTRIGNSSKLQRIKQNGCLPKYENENS